MNNFVQLCLKKWPTAKVVISLGIVCGDSAELNRNMHACNIKLQNNYLGHKQLEVSFCDNSSLGVRGQPNLRLYRSDKVHLAREGTNEFVTNLKFSIHRALYINSDYRNGQTNTTTSQVNSGYHNNRRHYPERVRNYERVGYDYRREKQGSSRDVYRRDSQDLSLRTGGWFEQYLVE